MNLLLICTKQISGKVLRNVPAINSRFYVGCKKLDFYYLETLDMEYPNLRLFVWNYAQAMFSAHFILLSRVMSLVILPFQSFQDNS